jgi:2-keto-4-pentenoate hydratase/2-oxohepta-3-ene-1,7-dioic acid hydratase in catechol pathway
MKLVRYQDNGGANYGILESDFVFEVIGDVYSDQFDKGPAVGGTEAVALLPPCEPKVITSIGANYVSRCKENNLPVPDAPGKGDRFFIPLEALTGPGDLIYLPPQEVRLEYSGELGIVIKRTCHQVSEAEAADYILGYTIVHNVWAKNPVRGEPFADFPVTSFIRAYESFCPTGPCVVTDIDPMNIAWETRVNGEVRQKTNTSKMLFGPAEMVANISSWHTLEPGDLIQCGTASGVGTMKPGDIVEIEFEGIGVLRNMAVAGPAMEPADLIYVDVYKGD